MRKKLLTNFAISLFLCVVAMRILTEYNYAYSRAILQGKDPEKVGIEETIDSFKRSSNGCMICPSIWDSEAIF